MNIVVNKLGDYIVIKTDKGNIAVYELKKPKGIFYGEHAVEEAEDYIIKLLAE